MRCMSALNKRASELMTEAKTNACTDVTGFGLIGHVCEMIGGDVGALIYTSSVPFFPEVAEFTEMGLIPGGLNRNRDFYMGMVDKSPELQNYMVDILFDPQTSGGLLISLPEKNANVLLERLHQEGLREAAIIGKILEWPKGRIMLK